MSALGKRVSALLADLDRPSFPANSICTHHGVSARHPGLSVNITTKAGRLLITMYAKDQCTALPMALHHARARSVGEAIGSEIIQTWNGEDGHNGISVIYGRPRPLSLQYAIENYGALPSPFDLRPEDRAGFEAFNAWVRGPAGRALTKEDRHG